MTFEIRAVDKSKLYTSIIDQIVEGVRAGAYRPGRALPPERILAPQLGVSRSSLREAIRVLEHAGVLDVRTGSGTYVRDGGASKAAMLRAHAAAAGEHSPLDIVAARRALEPACAALASQNRQLRDIEALQSSIQEQAGRNRLGEDPEEPDLVFHLSVAVASHNPVMLILVERLIDIMRQGTWRELKHRTRERQGSADRYLEQHRTILAAIENQDSGGAARAMREHLKTIEQRLLAEVD
jgi:GntR family transcriptional regulator, transcriptional repressor for pyruvate dehydrogenase complex